MQRVIIRLTVVALTLASGAFLVHQSQPNKQALASQGDGTLKLPPRPDPKPPNPIEEPPNDSGAPVQADHVSPIRIGAEDENPASESLDETGGALPSAYYQATPDADGDAEPPSQGDLYGGVTAADSGLPYENPPPPTYNPPAGDANAGAPPITQPDDSPYGAADPYGGDPYGGASRVGDARAADPYAASPYPAGDPYGQPPTGAPPEDEPASDPPAGLPPTDPTTALTQQPSATISGVADAPSASIPSGNPAPPPTADPSPYADPYSPGIAPAPELGAFDDAASGALPSSTAGPAGSPPPASPPPAVDPLAASPSTSLTPSQSSPPPSALGTEPPRTMAPITGQNAPSTAPPAAPAPAARQPAGVPGIVAAASPSPGPLEMEGRRTPTITVERSAPEEVQVGRAADFTILVRNDGAVTAHDVMVFDRIPSGSKFSSAEPQAERMPDGALYWRLGDLKPGERRELTMQVIPEQEGEIGSIARVVFQAAASARTLATRPALAIEQTGPEQVLIGDPLTYSILISNPGTGAAYGVVLEADIPDGLQHPAGRALEYPVGTLRPGEKRELSLRLTADKPGKVASRLAVRGDGGLRRDNTATLRILAPQLAAAIEAPARRYIDRPATYVVRLDNQGTASARNVEIAAYLPRGMKFNSANNHGEYDARRHAVIWNLVELGAGDKDLVQLVATPHEAGEHTLRLEGKGDLGVALQQEHAMQVDTLNELSFTVADVADPIEVGSTTTYEVRVTNSGAQPDGAVRVAVELPQGLQALPPADGTAYTVQQQVVAFPELETLAANGSATFRFRARGAAAGDHRVRVQVVSREAPTPVVKEEATRVYNDR